MKYVRDTTGRFGMRPHYEPQELDRDCERIVTTFLKEIHGIAQFPIATDDLTKLIERDTESLDMYADLTDLGPNVEGVTEFRRNQKPIVKISSSLSENDRRDNRLRTTLTHEYGHVHYHRFLFDTENAVGDLLSQGDSRPDKVVCKRDNILGAKKVDWMEWQAGYVSGALLMPISYVRKLCADYQEQHGLFGATQKDSAHSQAMVGLVMETFKVSEEAARVRLLKLNFLGDAAPAISLFAQ